MLKKLLLLIAGLCLLTGGSLWWHYNFSGEAELYLLPDKFRGIVVVVFNQPAGEVRRYEQGKRVYHVPETGVLRTQFPLNDGWRSWPEFYYVREGQRVPLGRAQVQVGRMQAGSTGTTLDSHASNEVLFFSFLIGRPKEIDSLYTLRERLDMSSL